jgi:hypothetical protein
MQHKIAQIQRCSRPLYSSQATGRNNPHPTPTPNTRKHQKQFDRKAATHTHHTPETRTRRHELPPCSKCPKKQHPLETTSSQCAHSLRTQQRAKTTTHQNLRSIQPSRRRSRRTKKHHLSSDRIIDVPSMSSHPRTTTTEKFRSMYA